MKCVCKPVESPHGPIIVPFFGRAARGGASNHHITNKNIVYSLLLSHPTPSFLKKQIKFWGGKIRHWKTHIHTALHIHTDSQRTREGKKFTAACHTHSAGNFILYTSICVLLAHRPVSFYFYYCCLLDLSHFTDLESGAFSFFGITVP